MRARPFVEVDVFGSGPHTGNPVAVVLEAEDLDTAAMQRLAAWTNLSETTFVLPPTTDAADYRVRIFTPVQELPFAGHPTLGTCHAWLERASGAPDAERVVQECGVGLVEIRRTEDGLGFAAPPVVRSGPVDDALLATIAETLGIAREEIADAQWVDNGPGWIAVRLESVERVLSLRPSFADLDLGVVALHEPGADCALEVRAFFPKDGVLVEDPVTGSLNASVAQWLLGTGRLQAPYVARQGTALGRDGRVHVSRDAGGTVWIAGATQTLVEGVARL